MIWFVTLGMRIVQMAMSQTVDQMLSDQLIALHIVFVGVFNQMQRVHNCGHGFVRLLNLALDSLQLFVVEREKKRSS